MLSLRLCLGAHEVARHCGSVLVGVELLLILRPSVRMGVRLPRLGLASTEGHRRVGSASVPAAVGCLTLAQVGVCSVLWAMRDGLMVLVVGAVASRREVPQKLLGVEEVRLAELLGDGLGVELLVVHALHSRGGALSATLHSSVAQAAEAGGRQAFVVLADVRLVACSNSRVLRSSAHQVALPVSARAVHVDVPVFLHKLNLVVRSHAVAGLGLAWIRGVDLPEERVHLLRLRWQLRVSSSDLTLVPLVPRESLGLLGLRQRAAAVRLLGALPERALGLARALQVAGREGLLPAVRIVILLAQLGAL